MIRLPSPRPVRMAQQICRLAGVAYLMIGAAIVAILVCAPNVGGVAGHKDLFEVKEGVWTSATLWWDGIINPFFHGTVFFALSSALGYLADLGEALIEKEYADEEAAEAAPMVGFDQYPELKPDDLQPHDK